MHLYLFTRSDVCVFHTRYLREQPQRCENESTISLRHSQTMEYFRANERDHHGDLVRGAPAVVIQSVLLAQTKIFHSFSSQICLHHSSLTHTHTHTHIQDALRRTMEKYSKVTRFCLICNYVSRIAGPISSRCAKFRFQSLSRETMKAQLKTIAEKENVPLSEEVCEKLLDCSGGDMRKAITSLQSSWQLYGDAMTPDAIDELSGVVPTNLLHSLWEVMVKNRNIDSTIKAVDELIAQGFSASSILSEIHTRIVNCDDQVISDIKKAHILRKIAEADYRLSDRTDEHLVLLDTSCFVAQTLISTPEICV